MDFGTFFPDILATLIGGAILAFLFFLLREKVFRLPDIDGSWVYEQTTTTSEYIPYQGMTVQFIALLARDGNRIYGSAEKTLDRTLGSPPREYVGEHRSRATLTGHIEKRYFAPDRISIHLHEEGERRPSTTFHILSPTHDGTMSGHFASTVANQTGTVTWRQRST